MHLGLKDPYQIDNELKNKRSELEMSWSKARIMIRTIEEFDDGFILHGGISPHKPKINTFYDHRIAMSAMIAATATQTEIELDTIDAIKTSFPNFLNSVLRIFYMLRHTSWVPF